MRTNRIELAMHLIHQRQQKEEGPRTQLLRNLLVILNQIGSSHHFLACVARCG